MTQRINYIEQAPQLFKKLVEFNTLAAAGAIEEKTADLIAIRASHMNGCGFCIDMHVKQATIHGERALLRRRPFRLHPGARRSPAPGVITLDAWLKTARLVRR
jgi:AhpD family alkylhydroperoxidase